MQLQVFEYKKKLIGGEILIQHINLTPSSKQYIELPLQYNHIVQAVIYNSLDEKLASFLHEKGFKYKKRAFKMFTFSRLMGYFKIKKDEQKIIFQAPISLVVSSPYDDFCNSLANGLLLKKKIRLWKTDMIASQITLKKEIVKSDKITIKTLSPIVLYSTFLKNDGSKYTCYFQPGENEHNELLTNNIRKKYAAFYDSETPEGNIALKPLRQPKLSIVNYKGTVIKGYSGEFVMTGPKPLLQMAIDCGLGSKNSQGFGCVEVVR